jgi:hypothetical protein
MSIEGIETLNIDTKIRFTGAKERFQLEDVTLGKIYVIEGLDEDGEEYFLDDVGERNFAASSFGGDGIYEIVEVAE